MRALRAYLSSQAELGTDEVMLPSPWKLQAALSVKALPVKGMRSAPVPEGNSLLEILSRSLPGESSAQPVPSAAKGAPPQAPPSLPAFSDLNAFWKYVEAGQEARIIRARGPLDAPLALVEMEPAPGSGAEPSVFSGDPGTLLEKMLRAIHLNATDLYLTSVVKVAGNGKAWSRRDLVRLLPLLHAELACAGVPLVLLMGEECGQAVLKTGKPMESLRREIHRMEGRAFAVTWHPRDLLLREELKRKAWEDLQWLEKRLKTDWNRP